MVYLPTTFLFKWKFPTGEKLNSPLKNCRYSMLGLHDFGKRFDKKYFRCWYLTMNKFHIFEKWNINDINPITESAWHFLTRCHQDEVYKYSMLILGSWQDFIFLVYVRNVCVLVIQYLLFRLKRLLNEIEL